MAAPGRTENINTEAVPDCVFIPEVVLPNQAVLKDYAFGWDNFVYDEIYRLMTQNKLGGKMADYDLQITSDKGPYMMNPKLVVEDYSQDLLKCTKVTLLSKNKPSTLPDLAVKPKVSEPKE